MGPKNRIVVARGCEMEEMGRHWSRGTFSCKINKFWESNAQNDDYS